jgi:DNA-binding response OmpR family regulator
VKILLIDDDLVFAAMIAEYLESENIACECAETPDQGLRRALAGEHDAVILDVMMPGMNGLDLLRQLRRESDLPVLMLTARGDGVDRVVGLEVGADDYIPKPVYPRELVARLNAVLRRGRAERERDKQLSEIVVGSLRMSIPQRECFLGGQRVTLTMGEFDLLRSLARQAGIVVSRDELSRTVLGRPWEAYDRSIDVHVSNLRHKLEASREGIEIETVRGIGYRLVSPP